MTKNELKETLKSYRALVAERGQIQAAYDALTSPQGQSLDGMPKGPGAGDPLARVATKRQALAEKYLQKLEELAAVQSNIEDVIEGLDPTTRQLLRYRYIEGLPWEEVCVAIGYSWRQTHNIHSAALDKILETLPSCPHWIECPAHNCESCGEYAALADDNK